MDLNLIQMKTLLAMVLVKDFKIFLHGFTLPDTVLYDKIFMNCIRKKCRSHINNIIWFDLLYFICRFWNPSLHTHTIEINEIILNMRSDQLQLACYGKQPIVTLIVAIVTSTQVSVWLRWGPHSCCHMNHSPFWHVLYINLVHMTYYCRTLAITGLVFVPYHELFLPSPRGQS